MALVTKSELVRLLASRELSRTDKLLVVLAYSDPAPLLLTKIIKIAKDSGLREIDNWDVSVLLGKTKGLTAKVKGGWMLTAQGRMHVTPELPPAPISDKFNILHTFAGAADNGRVPYGLLNLHG